MIHQGDLFDVLPTLDAESIDACVTDPPYDLIAGSRGGSGRSNEPNNPYGRHGSHGGGFMGLKWDSQGVAFRVDTWEAVMRVLKPGAYIAAFGGSRTFHRLTCAIEDAGFEIRDCLSWLYGQGFPKSLNLGDGRGTALKPAWEPIVLARKPFKGSVTANVAAHGTGALNVDACRIESGLDHAEKCASVVGLASNRNGNCYGEWSGTREDSHSPLGRWPSNVLLDEHAAALLDAQTGEMVDGVAVQRNGGGQCIGSERVYGGYDGGLVRDDVTFGGRGGASRFYYVAKPSREERDYGTDGLTARQRDESRKDGNPGGDNPRNRGLQPRGNFHPTVKPVELMRWLVRLVTPVGGTVLDPFLGSGTTGMACRYELCEFVGIEREAEYVAIAERRIAAVAPLFAPVGSPAWGTR